MACNPVQGRSGLWFLAQEADLRLQPGVMTQARRACMHAGLQCKVLRWQRAVTTSIYTHIQNRWSRQNACLQARAAVEAKQSRRGARSSCWCRRNARANPQDMTSKPST